MNTPEDFLKKGSGSGDGEEIFSGMHDVEIVVIRCYFNNNFILIIMILMNKVVRHILFICVVIRQLAIYDY